MTRTSIALLFLAVVAAMAQISPDLSAKLQSANWVDRQEAYSIINAKGMPSPEEEAALIALLSRENQITQEAYREGAGASGKYGEAYSEYTAWLAEAVMKIAQKEPTRADIWIPLLSTDYFPDSPFGKMLASHGDKTAEFLIAQAANHPEAYRRGDALVVLAEIVDYERNSSTTAHHLSTPDVERIQQVVRRGIDDKEATVRWKAVSALALIGSREDLAALERVALTDPQVVNDGGPTGAEIRFPVRLVAAQAAERLRKRLDTGQAANSQSAPR